MTLNLPNRFVWLLIGAVILFLLQSGCQPIQPLAAAATVAANEEGARANLSTNITTESHSPDGAWTATSLFQIPRGSQTYYQSLTVTHASGEPSYTLVDGEFPLALGYPVATPLMWSADSTRFYYTNRPQADGCALLYNGSDLHRLDVVNGETTELLPEDTTTTLALAPDEQHVAYLALGAATLHIHDLGSSETTTFDLAPLVTDAQPGAFTWSPDSSRVAFVTAHKPCAGGWAEATSLYTLDTTAMTLTPYLERDDRLLHPVAWPTEATLSLENHEGKQFTLDLASDEIRPQ